MRSTQTKSKSIFKRHFNYPGEHNRVANKRLWLTKFDKIVREVDGDAEFLIELDEEWNFWYVSWLELNTRLATDKSITSRFFFWLLILATALSASSAIVYSHYTDDASTAISLASYIVTCLALLLALVAAGDYVGLQKPGDGVNFDYNSTNGDFDMVTGKELQEKLDASAQDRLKKSRREAEQRKKRDRGSNEYI
jgi:hypothetical protein